MIGPATTETRTANIRCRELACHVTQRQRNVMHGQRRSDRQRNGMMIGRCHRFWFPNPDSERVALKNLFVPTLTFSQVLRQDRNRPQKPPTIPPGNRNPIRIHDLRALSRSSASGALKLLPGSRLSRPIPLLLARIHLVNAYIVRWQEVFKTGCGAGQVCVGWTSLVAGDRGNYRGW